MSEKTVFEISQVGIAFSAVSFTVQSFFGVILGSLAAEGAHFPSQIVIGLRVR